jgi:hypothetical protein
MRKSDCDALDHVAYRCSFSAIRFHELQSCWRCKKQITHFGNRSAIHWRRPRSVKSSPVNVDLKTGIRLGYP